MSEKYFYEKNTEFIESDVNKTFEEILWMTDDEFRNWVSDMRNLVVKLWDVKGQPPRVGYNEDEIIHQFKKMENFPVNKFLVRDELTEKEDVIRNTSVVGNAVNQWFPTMMQTRINYNGVEKAKSIYDYFAKEELFESQVTYSRRHFKRDSFYHYSNPIRYCDPDKSLIFAETGKEWIEKFEELNLRHKGYDYWLEPREIKEAGYTGYSDDLRDVTWLRITKDELKDLDIVPEKSLTNIDYGDYDSCRIRLYKYGQKIFPIGLKAFRVSYCQYAVNFPPLTAKLVYEKFTEEFKGPEKMEFSDREPLYIWDPSAGWGGRLLGALSCKTDRKIHYIGTDPNKDHTLPNGKTKYDDFAEFYNSKAKDHQLSFFDDEKHSWEIHQCGSEVFRDTEAFQKYKGKVSVVFTSPPYFAKEIYSEDPEQSCHKFTQYKSWRDDFLQPTLETAFELLKPGGYLIWNIADAQFNGTMLPLEEDSCEIMKNLGLQPLETLKMALAQMPGGNRVDPETGQPTAKNFCKVNGLWLKYEPFFIFRKPPEEEK